jgi:hypothetical protein
VRGRLNASRGQLAAERCRVTLARYQRAAQRCQSAAGDVSLQRSGSIGSRLLPACRER